MICLLEGWSTRAKEALTLPRIYIGYMRAEYSDGFYKPEIYVVPPADATFFAIGASTVTI